MNKNVAVQTDGLMKAFGSMPVLDGVDVRVERGSMLALLGPNGAGKTTLIRILSTLLRPDGGTAAVNGYDVCRHPHAVRRSIGLTGQYAAVDEFLTGKENLHMIGRLYHVPRQDIRRRAQELLERFDLLEARDRAVKTYSGGMRRKLDLAAGLIGSPPVVFLDEPTTGLDPRSRRVMWDCIRELMKADITIVMTTQYLEEADALANRIAVLDNGKIVVEGTADTLKSAVGNRRLELMLGGEEEYRKTCVLFSEQGLLYAEKSGRVICVTTDGSVASVRAVLERLAVAGIEMESFSLRKPSLDDVFLHFTGHDAQASQ